MDKRSDDTNKRIERTTQSSGRPRHQDFACNPPESSQSRDTSSVPSDSARNLRDVPKKLWWSVYIDAPFHEEAMKKSDPGKLFDDQRSPGYQRSIIEALDTFVAREELQQKDLDYDL